MYNPGDIYYHRDRDLPTHYFWRVIVTNGNMIRRFTFIDPNRFVYDPPGQTEYNARLIKARLVKDNSFQRKKIVRAIFKAAVFETHSPVH